jgi:organic radical activating enzyme
MKRIVNFGNLEIHVTHSCNLTCESCSHYCNHGHKGILSLDEAESWMDAWNKQLNPRMFSLLGGEPTLHPQLSEFVRLSRSKWPRAHLRIATNGFFLHRHKELLHVLRKDPNTHIEISIHHNDPEYFKMIETNYNLLRKWNAKYGIKVKVTVAFKKWTRRYKGFGNDMVPYEDNRPQESWENCPAKGCFQLFEGKLWKCAPLAYLKLQDAKYNLSKKWRNYLSYQPLQPDCTNEQLHYFFKWQAEDYCSMCASKPERFNLNIPLASTKL